MHEREERKTRRRERREREASGRSGVRTYGGSAQPARPLGLSRSDHSAGSKRIGFARCMKKKKKKITTSNENLAIKFVSKGSHQVLLTQV